MSSNRRPTFRFSEMGITRGSELISIPEKAHKVTVIDDRKVSFRGQEMGLTVASKKVREDGKRHLDWTFNGRLFEDIYNETYGARIVK